MKKPLISSITFAVLSSLQRCQIGYRYIKALKSCIKTPSRQCVSRTGPRTLTVCSQELDKAMLCRRNCSPLRWKMFSGLEWSLLQCIYTKSPKKWRDPQANQGHRHSPKDCQAQVAVMTGNRSQISHAPVDAASSAGIAHDGPMPLLIKAAGAGWKRVAQNRPSWKSLCSLCPIYELISTGLWRTYISRRLRRYNRRRRAPRWSAHISNIQ